MRKTFLAAIACLLGSFSYGQAQNTDLAPLLESIRVKYHLPALAAAVSVQGKVLAQGVTGLRKLGSPDPVQIGDQWHLGSDGKSLTATLAAMLVEDGKIQWTSTIGDAFPEWHDTMNPVWRTVTLEQLLTHHSGLATNPPNDLWLAAWAQTGTPTEQRLAFIRGLLALPPAYPPGSRFEYSNQGYAVAGTMLERVAGMPFEELLLKRLCQPLGLTSAGFGAPGEAGKISEPWGHAWDGKKLQPIEPGPAADNPPAISPAGRLHLSIGDFVRYAAWQAGGEKHGSTQPPLSKESFLKLHTPAAGQDYALGWEVVSRDWAGGTALTHNGSNTRWFALIWVAPQKEATFVVTTNALQPESFPACDETVGALIQQYLLK